MRTILELLVLRATLTANFIRNFTYTIIGLLLVAAAVVAILFHQVNQPERTLIAPANQPTALPTPSASADCTPVIVSVGMPPPPCNRVLRQSWLDANKIPVMSGSPVLVSARPIRGTNISAPKNGTEEPCLMGANTVDGLGQFACVDLVNYPGSSMVGLSAKWTVPDFSPDLHNRMIPWLMLGGHPMGGLHVVALSMEEHVVGDHHEWEWIGVAGNGSFWYCKSGCPVLHPRNTVTASMFDSNGWTTDFRLTNVSLNTARAMTLPSEAHSTSSVGVFVAKEHTDAPVTGLIADFTFRDVTVYQKDKNGQIAADLLDAYSPTTSTPGEFADRACTEGVDHGSFSITFGGRC